MSEARERPGAPSPSGERLLCALEELDDPGSRGFEREREADRAGLFVVRRGERVYGYRDLCPHTGAPLEWQPHQFLDAEGSFIQCSWHGALFRIEDGRCLRGPCAGQALEPVAVVVRDGRVFLVGHQ